MYGENSTIRVQGQTAQRVHTTQQLGQVQY